MGICKLLTKDPTERCTAKSALKHEWFKVIQPSINSVSLNMDFVNDFRNFHLKNKFEKTALCIIAGYLNDETTTCLRNTFKAIDANNDGVLTLNKVIQSLKDTKALPSDFEQIMDDIDIDGDVEIGYSEFLAIALGKKHIIYKDMLLKAFTAFDADSDGKISKEDLCEVLFDFGDDAAQVLQDVDQNNDKMIDFEEFTAMISRSWECATCNDIDGIIEDTHLQRPKSNTLLQKLIRFVAWALRDGCLFPPVTLRADVADNKRMTMRSQHN